MYKVGSARISENNSVRGRRGDQTGQECKIQPAYMHKYGWVGYRPKSDDVANGLSFSMACACNLNRVGYSQDDRYAVFFHGIDGELTNADCSTLVPWCVLNCGIQIDVNGIWTGNLGERLLATGQFDKVAINSIEDMCTGDILIDGRGTAHTVIVVEGRPRISNAYDIAEPVLSWGSQGGEVMKWQRFLNDFAEQGLTIDGDFKQKTFDATVNFQRFLGLTVDGVYGDQCKFASGVLCGARGLQAV